MKHIAIIQKPPVRSGRESTPDGAITGNGDLAVILGESPVGLRVFLSKTDVWYAVENESMGGLRPVGYIDIPVPPAQYGDYYVEQDMDAAVLRCRFGAGEAVTSAEIRVAEGENAVLIELTGGSVGEPVLHAYDLGDITGENGAFSVMGAEGVFRSFAGSECLYETHVYAALRCVDERRYYAFVATNHDCPAPQETAAQKVSSVSPERFAALKDAHAAYWADFWKKSSFSLSDPALENEWYASQYFLAVCARNPGFPPGLYGNFVTVEKPNWHSDYHLNYNYQAPFYAACSSNHPELTDGYLAPLEAFVPRGRAFAARLGCKGVLFPCGLGPKGYMTEFIPGIKYEFERPFMGQKNDALHAADIAVFRWNATKDLAYARDHAYPYLRECLDFFADYAVLEKGRYAVRDDAIHEAPYYRSDFDEKKYPFIHDKNNVLTLGLLRLTIPAAIEMAEALGVDANRREKWADLLARLADFPTFIRRGKRVYRYTERGMPWNDGNDVGQQHIFPCGCVGLSSPKKELEIALNTVNQRKYCFSDGNAVSSFYAIAARVGFNAAYMTDRLREFNDRTRLPNLLHSEGGGGLEYCAVNATALNEMALQSHQGTVRIYPAWDMRLNCAYENLRADGAFLVSAAVENGRVRYARVFSEKGGKLRVCYPETDCTILLNGAPAPFTLEALECGVDTAPGDTVDLLTRVREKA